MDHMSNLKKSFKSMKWYEWLMAAIMVLIAAYAMASAFADPSSSSNPPWLTILNFISAVCGVVCIFFCAKANISNFAFGLVNTVVYAIYLAYWHIWGTMCLEIFFYFPINIISWMIWARHRDSFEQEKTKAKKLTALQDMAVGVVVVVSTVVYHAILVRVGGNVAWLDAATVSIGIIATILEMLRYREQYVLWLITDVVAVAMFIQHFDAVYLTKKSIYLIMAVVGLVNWCRLQRRNEANE